MLTAPERWELGSEFHQISTARVEEGKGPSPWDGTEVIWSSTGRDGIRLLLNHGTATRGWRRCWLPSYLCQEVVAAARSTGITCSAYPSNPLEQNRDPDLHFGQGDVILAVHHFGLASCPKWLNSLSSLVDVIEDHTHDPWSEWATHSRATYAFASLRKTLPIAEGTPIWSPLGASLPEQPQLSEIRARASALKHQGMCSKARYLAGESVSKDSFRKDLLEGESKIASGAISGISPDSLESLKFFPTVAWRGARLANAEYLRTRIGELKPIQMLGWTETSTPFSAILLFANQTLRDRIRTHLVESSIYPAVLWARGKPGTGGVSELDHSLANRMLSVHCDGRYDQSDMDRLAAAIIEGNSRWL